MSKTGIKIKIDVKKIQKALLYAGEKGTYLDATVFVDDAEDQYGNNGMITQDVSKEARDAGQQGPILGNVKVFWRGESAPQQKQKAAQRQPEPEPDFMDDVPF